MGHLALMVQSDAGDKKIVWQVYKIHIAYMYIQAYVCIVVAVPVDV